MDSLPMRASNSAWASRVVLLVAYIVCSGVCNAEADVDAPSTIEEEATEDGSFSVGSSVVELSDADFHERVAGGRDGVWFVKFYAPWCGHCKSLAPKWDELPARLDGQVTVAKVDVTQEKAIGAELEIQGFPTLKLFADSGVYTYSGDREVDQMVEWATGGYKSSSIERLPQDKTMVDTIQKEVHDYVTKMEQVHSFMPTLLPSVLLVGFLAGYILLRFFLGEPRLDVFIEVKVVRDDKGIGGFSLDPERLRVVKIDEGRPELKDMALGDKVLAVNDEKIKNAKAFKTAAHGHKSYKLSLGRSSKAAAAIKKAE